MLLDKIIEESMIQMSDFLSSSNWFGRENEVVNLFAHKFLLQNFDGSILQHPTQIGIEVAVKQIDSSSPRSKALVRKDLVIWPTEYQTVWNETGQPSNVPLAVIEWKVNDIQKCKYDIEWLFKFTKEYPSVLGYSACAFVKNRRIVTFKRIKNGKSI